MPVPLGLEIRYCTFTIYRLGIRYHTHRHFA